MSRSVDGGHLAGETRTYRLKCCRCLRSGDLIAFPVAEPVRRKLRLRFFKISTRAKSFRINGCELWAQLSPLILTRPLIEPHLLSGAVFTTETTRFRSFSRFLLPRDLSHPPAKDELLKDHSSISPRLVLSQKIAPKRE
jgi:hypothetical protein